MYLYKSPNSVYYARVFTHKRLKNIGFPFDFKISLRTKDKRKANVIGLGLVSAIKYVLYTTQASCFSQFENSLNEIIRLHLVDTNTSIHLPEPEHVSQSQPDSTRAHSKLKWETTLKKFVETKQKQGVVALTEHQLHQRVGYFFETMCLSHVDRITSLKLMEYIDHLNQSDLSPKTCKEYYAALTQLICWSSSMEFLKRNVAADVKAVFKQIKVS